MITLEKYLPQSWREEVSLFSQGLCVGTHKTQKRSLIMKKHVRNTIVMNVILALIAPDLHFVDGSAEHTCIPFVVIPIVCIIGIDSR